MCVQCTVTLLFLFFCNHFFFFFGNVKRKAGEKRTGELSFCAINDYHNTVFSLGLRLSKTVSPDDGKSLSLSLSLSHSSIPSACVFLRGFRFFFSPFCWWRPFFPLPTAAAAFSIQHSAVHCLLYFFLSFILSVLPV